MITIVPATIQETKILIDIGRQTLIESHGHSAAPCVMQTYLGEKFTESALHEELSDTKNIFHIINYNNQAAGYSKIIYSQSTEQVTQKNITRMERLYLLQEYYNLRLGQQLLQYNIDISKQQGEQGMWLYVWKENERALRFYSKAGFQIIGDGWFRLTGEYANPSWKMFLQYEE
jgi:ribosomal protein S18 acetylase RimI-like enzyme